MPYALLPFLLAASTPVVVGTTRRNGGTASRVGAVEVLGTADGAGTMGKGVGTAR